MPTAADDIIHQQLRLKIMAALQFARASIDFTQLKSIVEATDGNLGAHLATLEQAGYITIDKDFNHKKPRTRISITRQGRKAFAQHVAYLREIIDGASSEVD
jgi:DNA-binding MarR family transcriptional regulator